MPILKNDTHITSLEEWERHADPKSANQWVDDRSAKETARIWLAGNGTQLPPDIDRLLAAHPRFGSISSWVAEPEAKLRFDDFPGEPRNSDLVVHAEDTHGRYLLAIEAKADEPFGDTVADTLASAIERALQTDRSNGIARTKQLTQRLLGPRQKGEPHLKSIRYQLLTACAGALCEAQRHGYSRALMLIHEFITRKTDDEKHRQNARDLDLFIRRLSHGATESIKSGEIVGPLRFPAYSEEVDLVQLYIGKVATNIRDRA